MARPTSLLSLCPSVEKRGERLVATTAWPWRVISLGLWSRQVTVDPEKQSIVIRRGPVGFGRRQRRIPFETVSAVVYGYDDWAMRDPLRATHESFDQFSVGLRLCDDEHVPLFSFVGEGTFTNESVIPDWWYWREFRYDLSGTQEKESRAFAEVLSRLIHVPIEAPLH